MSTASAEHSHPGYPAALFGGQVPDRFTRFRLGLGEVEIAVLDWGGEGPPALLHHANGLCAATLGPIAALLRGRYRVFGMDARGHGDSTVFEDPARYQWSLFQADWVGVAEHIVRECQAPIALGLGHSLGGTATMLGAAARPDLIEELALVEAVIPIRSREQADPARIARLKRLVSGAKSRRAHWPSRSEARDHLAVRRFFANWQPEALDLYLSEGLREMSDGCAELKCPGAVEAAIFSNGQGLDAIGAAANVKCPATWIWARGGDFSRALYEEAAAAMGSARVADVDGGHMVPMEAPERVLEALGA